MKASAAGAGTATLWKPCSGWRATGHGGEPRPPRTVTGTQPTRASSARPPRACGCWRPCNKMRRCTRCWLTRPACAPTSTRPGRLGQQAARMAALGARSPTMRPATPSATASSGSSAVSSNSTASPRATRSRRLVFWPLFSWSQPFYGYATVNTFQIKFKHENSKNKIINTVIAYCYFV